MIDDTIPPPLYFFKLHMKERYPRYLFYTFVALSILTLALLQQHQIIDLKIDAKYLFLSSGIVFALSLIVFGYRQYDYSRDLDPDDQRDWGHLHTLPLNTIMIFKNETGYKMAVHNADTHDINKEASVIVFSRNYYDHWIAEGGKEISFSELRYL